MLGKNSYSWTDKHILIVEDDESSSVLLREMLKKTGAHLAFSATGEEAVEHVKNHPETDLVLMDIHLPKKDGITATNEIRELRNKKIIVIAQSAYLLTAEQQQASLTRFDDFVTKPLNQYLLLAKIDKYLS